MGMHHHGIHYYPIEGSSTLGLLVMNHEYTKHRDNRILGWNSPEWRGCSGMILLYNGPGIPRGSAKSIGKTML